jgi:hypothetical protein
MSSQLGDIADRKSPAYYIVMRAQEREVGCVHRIARPCALATSIVYEGVGAFRRREGVGGKENGARDPCSAQHFGAPEQQKSAF